jgi:hypothetical protein
METTDARTTHQILSLCGRAQYRGPGVTSASGGPDGEEGSLSDDSEASVVILLLRVDRLVSEVAEHHVVR